MLTMKNQLSNRIITYILKRKTVTLRDLEGLVVQHGYTLNELYQALEVVHRDKRITNTASVSGEVTYKLATAKKAPSTSHLTWLRHNYPRMDSTNDGSGLDVGDLSWLFLKTKAERDEFRARMTGKPVHVQKRSRHST